MKFVVFCIILGFALCQSDKSCKTQPYPLFKQCDTRWGSFHVGSSSKTICQVGCLMSSMSMSLNGRNKTILGYEATPRTLNDYLTTHGGYASGDLFIWGSVSVFGYKYIGKSKSQSDVVNYVCSNHVVILNVHHGGHWVLATGVTSSGYTVNDPGFSTTSYTFDQVVQAAVYSVN